VDSRVTMFFSHLAQSLSFEERTRFLTNLLMLYRDHNGHHIHRMTIRRTKFLDDSLLALSNPDIEWKGMLQVIFVNAGGKAEPGQDLGGLLREFLEQLAGQIFNPEFGLFTETSDRQLYPNPESKKHREDHLSLFQLAGTVLGKCIFDGVVIEPQFAPFFLAKILGRVLTYYDLQSLDGEMFRNLQMAKEYPGDVENDLCLNFTVAKSDGTEHELIPDGKNAPVTSDNRISYVERVSYYKLNTEIGVQSEAFIKGVQKVMKRKTLQMFSERELQLVISGSSAAIDIEDWKNFTRLSGYAANAKHVQYFWRAVQSMDPKTQADLLRFVTSCSRVPLRGFCALQPPFTLQRMRIVKDSERLPVAATCFNTLKLPTYSSAKVMHDKLLLAVTSGAGFELE